MYYLKYRPKTVEALDNTHVKEVISNVLSGKNIPHAFLFVGQKGTGKTSTARIMAKAVNCLKNKFGGKSNLSEPCNVCENCMAVESSRSADVIELDAASNRGIEDVRNLIRESNFIPMSTRYRVFIIDEAHMITQDAFNALLKTLEEPSSGVIFILATTNLEKIPKTISSRCFVVNFGRAKKADIVSMLKKVVKSEKIAIDEELLPLIARHSDSSFRDAAKLLEELVTQKKLNLAEGKRFLGLHREDLLLVLAKGTPKDALAWISEFVQKGGNIKNLIERLLEELRIGLLAAHGVTGDSDGRLTFSSRQIVLLMKLLTVAYQQLRITPVESIPLEIAIVEFYNEKKEV